MSQIVRSLTLIGGDGIVLRAGTPATPDPSGWWLGTPDQGTLEGWWEPPAPRAEATARPQADGAYAPASLLVDARLLTVVLHHGADTPAQERAARSLLAALARGWMRVVVEEQGGIFHVRAFCSAQVKATHVTGTVSTWSLILTCPDPLIYGGPGDDGDLSSWESSEGVRSFSPDGGLLFPLFDQSPTMEATTGPDPVMVFTGARSSSLILTNTGTAASWPVLEVDGPVGRASWSMGDQVVEWGSPVPAGVTLRISTYDGAVSIGGVRSRRSGLARDNFFRVPPGQSAVAVDSDVPARMRVRWLSAWT